MVADLVVVAVLLALLDRISRGALINWLKTVRVPWSAMRSSRYLRLLVALVIIAVCAWAQSVVGIGAAKTLDSVWSGTSPYETQQCFTVQTNIIRNAEHTESKDLRGRCPAGGGDFDLNRPEGCPAHGQVPR